MAGFILWSASLTETAAELSFFATSTGFKRIQRGTTAMLTDMLAALGLAGVSFRQWEVDYFVTHYLMDEPPSDNWRDIWSDTWEITVQLAAPITLSMEPTTLIRAAAGDTTWQGDDTFHSARCVVVGDFFSSETVAKALPVLSQISHLHLSPSLLDHLHDKLPFINREIFARVAQACQALNADLLPPHSPVSIRQRSGLPKQLLIDLGRFDESFFAQGAELAYAVADLVYELDGTTTWNETTHPNQYT
jgi:hypothetical protein